MHTTQMYEPHKGVKALPKYMMLCVTAEARLVDGKELSFQNNDKVP